ncbi:Short-chain dehydrogenase [Sulfurivirga caldicuralii]|uniref:Short-chain dehydrogenase n=1 Tax=Sulfurivirga caldicuralii TaxID=364032 RepID=A0A1N6F6U1_9GAMM|nr:SDR family NAD(P)-dependent oxidoreductase [Sulfurivirga caldicuralii]SIN90977.1 Short-chain dehydrogenase [Sulfurivirga caldicuralii]
MKHAPPLQPGDSVLITGCSSGIGYHAAHALNQAGFDVIASARKAKDVTRLQQEGLKSVQLDLDDDTSIATGFDAALSLCESGRLRGLFNNGAFGLPGAVEDLSREALLAQFHTNVFGTQVLTNHMIAHLRQHPDGGRIVHNSSVLGFAAMAYRGAYNASKFALEGLADTQRLELWDEPIDVVLIEPGPITSRFRENAYAAFQRWIDAEHSAHRAQYEAMIQRLKKEGPAAPFTLGPEAVSDKLLLALTRRAPAARYPVTVPTHAFAWLKRLLPTPLLDRLLLKAGGNGKR